MRYRFKKIYSWLLILIMAMGTVQGALAMEFSQNYQQDGCLVKQMSSSDANDSKTGGSCPMEQDEKKCIDSECIAPGNFLSLQPAHATQLSVPAEFQQQALTGCNAILSHYPDLFKRPPKV